MDDEARVTLKRPEWEDMEFVRRLWADPETMAPVGGAITLSDEKARQWFERIVDPGSPTDEYRLVLNENGQPVGEVSCHRIDRDTMTGELNIKTMDSERGKGYARAALRLFLGWFFGEFGGRRIVDGLYFDNVVGQQALLRSGFEHDPTDTDAFVVFMTRERFHELYPEPWGPQGADWRRGCTFCCQRQTASGRRPVGSS